MIDAEALVEPAPGAGPLSTVITDRPLTREFEGDCRADHPRPDHHYISSLAHQSAPCPHITLLARSSHRSMPAHRSLAWLRRRVASVLRRHGCSTSSASRHLAVSATLLNVNECRPTTPRASACGASACTRSVGSVAAGREHPHDRRPVLAEITQRRPHPEPGAHRHQPCPIDDARHAEVDRHVSGRAHVPPRARLGCDRRRSTSASKRRRSRPPR